MTTVAMPPPTIGPRGIGLSGPIGASVDGTTATGTVDSVWPTIDLPVIDLGVGAAAGVVLAVTVAVVAAAVLLAVSVAVAVVRR